MSSLRTGPGWGKLIELFALSEPHVGQGIGHCYPAVAFQLVSCFPQERVHHRMGDFPGKNGSTIKRKTTRAPAKAHEHSCAHFLEWRHSSIPCKTQRHYLTDISMNQT